MTEERRAKSGLRSIADAFVVALPGGVRTRARVHLTAAEGAAVEQIGTFLGTQYRQTLASRISLGVARQVDKAPWRRERKQALTAATSSRWAGAITRVAEDSYNLGMRGLNAQVSSLHAAVAVIQGRLDAPVGGEVRDPQRPKARPVRGYATEAERFAKSRRKAHLEERLTDALERLEAGLPRIVAGGGRLWRGRQHLRSL